MNLFNAREIGTMNSYFDNINKNSKCRPFNRLSFYDNYIEKNAITSYGEEVAKKEKGWYKFISGLNYQNIPKIYPAIKRGIPVKTKYILPIRIQFKE